MIVSLASRENSFTNASTFELSGARATYRHREPYTPHLNRQQNGVGDAVAGVREAAELLDVHVDLFAGPLPFIARHLFGWFKFAPPIQAMAHKNASDRCTRQASLSGNPDIEAFVGTPRHKTGAFKLAGVRDGLESGVRNDPSGRNNQTGCNAAAICNRAYAHASRAGHVARMFLAFKATDQYLSTFRCQTGILVDFHSVPLLITDGFVTSAFQNGIE